MKWLHAAFGTRYTPSIQWINFTTFTLNAVNEWWIDYISLTSFHPSLRVFHSIHFMKWNEITRCALLSASFSHFGIHAALPFSFRLQLIHYFQFQRPFPFVMRSINSLHSLHSFLSSIFTRSLTQPIQFTNIQSTHFIRLNSLHLLIFIARDFHCIL